MKRSIVFYSVYCNNFDNKFENDDTLCTVRERYFKLGGTLSADKTTFRSSSNYRCTYSISDTGLSWKRTKDNKLIEEAVATQGGGYVVNYYDEGIIVKRITFSSEHILEKNEYFCSGDNTPVKTLKVVDDDTIEMFDVDKDNDEEKSVLLKALPYPLDIYSFDYLERHYGKPMAYAKTNMGIYYFCTEEILRGILSSMDKKLLILGIPEENKKAEDNKHEDISLDTAIENSSELEPTASTGKYSSESVQNEHKAHKLQYTEKESKNTIIPGSERLRNIYTFNIDGKEYTFVGAIVDDSREGFGYTLLPNGNIAYIGDYHKDKRNGFGISNRADGRPSHIGNWQNNLKDGIGIQFDKNNDLFFVSRWIKDKNSKNCTIFNKNGLLSQTIVDKGNSKSRNLISWDQKNKNFFVHSGKEYSGFLFNAEGKLLYKGSMCNNKRNGFGAEFREDGQVIYKGNFKNDLPNGHGAIKLKNGNYLEAVFINGKAGNDVREVDKTGFVIYDGEWKNNQRNGNGVLYIKNGGHIKGCFKDGKIDGKAKGYNKFGDLIYEGEWKDLCFSGKGTFYSNHEKVYEGDFEDDEFNGKGKLYYNGELIYAGGFKDGKREGLGILYKNGAVRYAGEWKNDVYDGTGAIFDNNKMVLCGCFVKGKKHGRINMIENGVVSDELIYRNNILIYGKKFVIEDTGKIRLLYVGHIKNRVPHGMGCIFDKYGIKKAEGLFTDGKFVRPMKVRLRKLKQLPESSFLARTKYNKYRLSVNYVIERDLGNGIIYTGMLDKNGLPTGYATVLSSDHVYIGNFDRGMPCGDGVLYKNDGLCIKGKFLTRQTKNSRIFEFENGINYICVVKEETENFGDGKKE